MCEFWRVRVSCRVLSCAGSGVVDGGSPVEWVTFAGGGRWGWWSNLRTERDSEPFFHLSVARDGVEQYAFTYAGGEVRPTGAIPRALDPSRFFGDPENGAGAERSLLEAVAGEFGARLPRHAIVNGRLHTFATHSWTRPPRDGETYATIRIHR
jgi:hypothetical protein